MIEKNNIQYKKTKQSIKKIDITKLKYKRNFETGE